MRLVIFCILCFAHSNFMVAQASSNIIKTAAEEALSASLHRFEYFLSLPNDAHRPDDLEANIDWLDREFNRLGFQVERLPTQGLDLLLASHNYDGAVKTLLIYLQVDGQPVDPSKWFQDDPFKPVLKARSNGAWDPIDWNLINGKIDMDWRIFSRSTADSKGAICAFLTAWEIMQTKGWSPNFNVKIIMDSEEELGSPNLPDAVSLHRDKLRADMLIIFDGPRHISNQPTLTFGARGITTMRITTYGPRVPQHSGHYGNYAPNPALHLSQLLASMKDDRGRVTIPGFYDGVTIDADTRAILEEVPDDEDQIKRNIGIAEPDLVGGTYQEAIQYPSLNIRGMASAWVGTKVRTIIPNAAVANLDIRTVKESDPERLVHLIRDHITNQGFHLCEGEPSEEERMLYPRQASISHK
ncbi:MAG: M20/M25/M40 family metallo-hydrolase, partial [Saprospiraceae bacterium]|nr:M20/M25/M40 family metallo-hydrolase [Saprospiraceae bacterium]